MVKIINIGPTEGNEFESQVKNLPLFVKIYHPNCGHCIQLQPEWNKFVNKLKKNFTGNIGIVTIHSDALSDIIFEGLKNINGYPTLRIIKNKQFIKDFDDKRTSDKLLQFCKKNFNLKKKINKTHKKKLQKNTYTKHIKRNELKKYGLGLNKLYYPKLTRKNKKYI